MVMQVEESLNGSHWAAAVVEGDTGKRTITDSSSDTSANLSTEKKAMVNDFSSSHTLKILW